MKYLIFSLLLLSFGLAPAAVAPLDSRKSNAAPPVALEKDQRPIQGQIGRLTLRRTDKVNRVKLFSNLSLACSGITLLASLLIPTSAFWAVILIVGGGLLLAITFLTLAMIYRVKEMRAGKSKEK